MLPRRFLCSGLNGPAPRVGLPPDHLAFSPHRPGNAILRDKVTVVQRLALFDMDNTPTNPDESPRAWGGEFAYERDLGREVIVLMIDLDRASYPTVKFSSVRFVRALLLQPMIAAGEFNNICFLETLNL